MNIIGYIHICQSGEWKKIFTNILNVIKLSNLYENTTTIRLGIVNNCGFVIDDEILHDAKFDIVYLGDSMQYERPTLLHMRNYSEIDDNTFYYYLHTKGISHYNTKKEINITDWTNLMLYWNIEKWKLAVEKLIEYNTYGCNYIENIHYSGNFWWAKNDYVKRLPKHIESYYTAPEDWICLLKEKHFTIFNSGLKGFGHYDNPYPRIKYDNIVNNKENYCIITNNCYGFQYYKKKNIRYNTPFIGLFLFSPCYIKLLENFEYYMNLIPIKKDDSIYGEFNYPICKLDDIEIHFLHYNNHEIAIQKWEERKKRMLNIEDCVIKLCDRDLFNQNISERFINLKYKHKKLFVTKNTNFFEQTINCSVTILPDNYNECPNGDVLEILYPFYNTFISYSTQL
jgi:uncharacterized protein (DUF1919 family)